MPQEIVKTIYNFAELIEKFGESGQPTQNARQFLQKAAVSYDWSEDSLDDWREKLASVGFTNAEIRFSGFGCQGDGASFTSNIDVELLLQFMGSEITNESPEHWEWICKALDYNNNPWDYRYLCLSTIADEYIEGKVERYIGSNYCHENTCYADLDLPDLGYKGEWLPASDGEPWGTWQPQNAAVAKVFEDWKEDVESFRRRLCLLIYQDLEKEYSYRMEDENLKELSEDNFMFDQNGNHEIV